MCWTEVSEQLAWKEEEGRRKEEEGGTPAEVGRKEATLEKGLRSVS